MMMRPRRGTGTKPSHLHMRATLERIMSIRRAIIWTPNLGWVSRICWITMRFDVMSENFIISSTGILFLCEQ